MVVVDASIVRRREDGSCETVRDPDVEGELALRSGWPSMFRGYLDQDERYRKCFAGDWYLTGDLAKRDADGYTNPHSNVNVQRPRRVSGRPGLARYRRRRTAGRRRDRCQRHKRDPSNVERHR